MFEEQQSYISHLKQAHAENLQLLLDPDLIAAHRTVRRDPERPCPFCLSKVETNAEMQNHVAAHLEAIAVWALPLEDEADISRDEESLPAAKEPDEMSIGSDTSHRSHEPNNKAAHLSPSETPYDDFNTATIQVLCEPGGKQQIRREVRAILDTGSDCNLISHNIVTSYLCMSDHIQVQDEKIAIPIMTLNGDEVTPNGKIELRFYGEGVNRRTYLETFQVVDGDVPWEVIIGKDFLREKGIYKRFGQVAGHPQKTAGGFSRFLSSSFGPLVNC